MTRDSRWPVTSAPGIVQILAWGSSYYLPAVLAPSIVADTGWPLPWVIGGLSGGLLVAGLVSPWVGRLIGRHGGRPVLAASALLLAVGQISLGLAPSLPVFLAVWRCSRPAWGRRPRRCLRHAGQPLRRDGPPGDHAADPRARFG